MKTLIALLLISAMCQAQENENLYHVIKVNGAIVNMNQDKSLTTGDKINGSDQLKFQTTNASALAINTKSEKFSLKEPSSIDIMSESKESITAMLSATPIISRNQLSMRGLVDEGEPIVDLKSYLGKETFTIIGDSLSLFLDGEIYPLNNNKFIVFHYNIQENKVSKKVGFNEQHLIIEKEKLMQSEGKKLEGSKIGSVEVFQFEKSTQMSEKITEIDLQFVNEETIKNEFTAIMPVLDELGMGFGEKQNYLLGYFGDVYGLTDQNIITSLIEEFLGF